MCSKQSYRSRRAANRSLAWLQRGGNYVGAAAYKCPTCGRWHIGRDTGYSLPWWKIEEKR